MFMLLLVSAKMVEAICVVDLAAEMALVRSLKKSLQQISCRDFFNKLYLNSRIFKCAYLAWSHQKLKASLANNLLPLKPI